MGKVIELTRTNPYDEPEERLICDCGHQFTRADFDIKYVVYIDATFDEDEFKGIIIDSLAEYVNLRSECPTCSCCGYEENEVEHDRTEDWMCCECGTSGFESESDALDCCA